MLQFPFLALRELKNHNLRRGEHEALVKKTPTDSLKIQTERTLHEAYYPGLNSDTLKTQNESQTVMRESFDRLGKKLVLIVPQVWIWRVGNFVISACSIPTRLRLKFSVRRRQEQLQIYWRCPQNPAALMGTIIADRIVEFSKPHHPAIPYTLDIFQRAIFTLLSDVADYTGNGTSELPKMDADQGFLKRTTQLQSELAIMLEILDK